MGFLPALQPVQGSAFPRGLTSLLMRILNSCSILSACRAMEDTVLCHRKLLWLLWIGIAWIGKALGVHGGSWWLESALENVMYWLSWREAMGFKVVCVSESNASLLIIYSFFSVYFSPVRDEMSSVKLDKNPNHLSTVLLSPICSTVTQHFEHSSL